jgi:hypothetical protein
VNERYAARPFVGMTPRHHRGMLMQMTETCQRLEIVRISQQPEVSAVAMGLGLGSRRPDVRSGCRHPRAGGSSGAPVPAGSVLAASWRCRCWVVA